jgi:hypothetical protein
MVSAFGRLDMKEESVMAVARRSALRSAKQRGGRQPAEEPPRQPAAIVENDARASHKAA